MSLAESPFASFCIAIAALWASASGRLLLAPSYTTILLLLPTYMSLIYKNRKLLKTIKLITYVAKIIEEVQMHLHVYM